MQKREETKLERRRREDLERLKRFRPMDDTFMRGLFKDDIPLVQLVLRIITGKPDLILLTCETQADMKRVTGARSICLDAGKMNYELLAKKTCYLKENPKGASEMCKAMEELRNESYAEGREEGREEGRAEGLKDGRGEGTFAALAGLVRDGLLSIQEASHRANMTEQELETALQRLK